MKRPRLDKFDARRDEPLDERLADLERLAVRRKLSRSEKVLSGLIYERVEDERGLRRIRTKGDQALFGGVTTRRMKKRLGVPKGRALADFLPAITIKAKEFANEITNFSIRSDYLHTEAQITREHIKNNRDVRQLLSRRRIVPEELPAAEDIEKISRRLESDKREQPIPLEGFPAPTVQPAPVNSGRGIAGKTAPPSGA
jgi:DNA-damage-inducible protein D